MFEGLSLKQIKQLFLKGESPTLTGFIKPLRLYELHTIFFEGPQSSVKTLS